MAANPPPSTAPPSYMTSVPASSASAPVPAPAPDPAPDPVPQVISDIPAADPSPTTVNGIGSRHSPISVLSNSNTPIPSPSMQSTGIPQQQQEQQSYQTSLSSTAPAISSQPQYIPQQPQYASQQPRQQSQSTYHKWRVPAYQSRAGHSGVVRPVIMDPPTQRQAAVPPAPVQPTGYPSPGKDSIYSSQKFNDDRARITFGIQQALPQAVRRAVRDNWEKCLLGSDFHQAYILNASIHSAPAAAIQRGIRDFGKVMVSAAKTEIARHLTTSDLDEISDLILAKASDEFLDKALAIRLRTIQAKPLINALARAERLGYETGDVVEEVTGAPAQEVVFPAPSGLPMPGPAPAPLYTPAPPQQMATGQPQMLCNLCGRKFEFESAFKHHTKHSVCTRTPTTPAGFKFSCQHCGQGFTTVVGLQYHNANKVCGDCVEPGISKMSPADLGAPNYSQAPAPSTPIAADHARHNARTSTPTSGSPATDPYAHLRPDQMAAMQEELRDAEIKYGERIRQANLIADEFEKKARLDALGNSFGTKQSLIRKKYGVRLRQRRTKAEIQQERERIHNRAAGGLPAGMKESFSTPRAAGPPPGASGWAPVNRPAPAPPARVSVPLPMAPTAPAAPAAMQGASVSPITISGTPSLAADEGADDVALGKHPREDDGAGDSPSHKRVSVADMGGLAGAPADAEMHDPTLPAPVPATTTTTANGAAATPTAIATVPGSVATAGATGPTTAADTATADRASAAAVSGSPEPMHMDVDGDSSDSDSDSGDIPATLPPSVRQSLHPQSSSRLSSS